MKIKTGQTHQEPPHSPPPSTTTNKDTKKTHHLATAMLQQPESPTFKEEPQRKIDKAGSCSESTMDYVCSAFILGVAAVGIYTLCQSFSQISLSDIELDPTMF